jgi:heat shock protein HslJ
MEMPDENAQNESGSQNAADMTAIEGILWQLGSYADVDGKTQPALADAPATLILQHGQFVGDTHCNSVAGEYTLEGDKITMQLGPSTLRACEPDIASQESGMMFGLSHAASYQIENGKLTLLDADGHVLLTFIKQPAPDLTGSTWQLISFNDGKGGMESNLTAENITITFGEDGQVSGNAGCNDFSGSYQIDGNRLTFGELATTRKMCAKPEGVMETEQAFLKNLSDAATFEVVGDALTLYGQDGGKLLVFQPAETSSLTGTPWRLQSFNNGKGGMATTLSTSKITAIFSEDGRIAGNAGCNNYSGGYQVDGGSIAIGPLAATEMYCQDPPDVMETEQTFLKNLGNAASFTIANDELTLFDSEGAKLLVFVPAQSTGLTDAPWRLQSFNNGKGGMESNLATGAITAVFGEDGVVTGFAGCNDYHGEYQTDGDKITVGPLAATRKMCAEPEGVMETEQTFLQNFQNAASFSIENERLTLFDADGNKLLVFEPGQ